MKKLISAALIAAVAIPVATVPSVANAQSARELRQDRREIRQERRDLREARRYGDRRDIRRERRDLREARREYREDRRDYRERRWGDHDWRRYRNENRRVFARGHWRAPFRYQRFRPGIRINSMFFGPRFAVNDPWRYRLPPAGRFQRYVRHYDDLLLVDVRRGIVVRVYNNFYW
ncbi:RcnB family protein [Sphingosinithalassobacter sp. CS137]|uniref:RcnB family protein n=1 Tax=Sphingosinithalassobacter sp. CS137 TaxID=2762748 RepID=UPI00165DCF48|nr:RcnB family protein [Sphingosinithalassobacter sp. CS137]